MAETVTVRPATRADLPALGELGALLIRTHHAFDAQRFMMPSESPEAGYAWFLGTQLASPESRVLVGEIDGRIAGYVYARIEPLSWEALLEECGFIHDLVVAESGRRHGVGGALLDAAIAWVRERGMPRVVLSTATQNTGAQRLFAGRGFRPTMVEMTRELA